MLATIKYTRPGAKALRTLRRLIRIPAATGILTTYRPALKPGVADVDEIRPQYSLNAPSANAIFASSIVRNNGTSIASISADLDNQITNIDSMWSLATPSYSDQVLPFNVTLSGANEYGAMTVGKILGIEIVVIDQVFPSFRPVCHLCNPLPDSAVNTSFQSMLAPAFRIYLAGRKQAETATSGCRLSGAVVSAESAEIGIFGVNQCGNQVV
jgi:hypothetical protein